MSKSKQVTGENLWPNEEHAIKQYETGKDKPKRFHTAEELIQDLHKEK